MELSSVFPPPTSTTKGADLCETDVTDVAIHSVTLLICLCGLAGNGAVLWLLTLQGPVARILHLAVSNILFLLLVLPSALLFLLEDVSCSPIMAQVYVSFLFQLSMMSYYWGLFRLTRIGAITNLRKLFQFCQCHHPLRVLWLVYHAQFWAFFALFTAIPTVTFLCPSHQQEHCWMALTSMFPISRLFFAAPMVITRTIDIIKAKCGSQQQQPRSSTSLSSSLCSSFSSSTSGMSCSTSATRMCPPRLFSCSPVSTAPSNPSSTSWQGGAGGPAP